MIYHWPECLQPGQNTTQVTQLVDIMPTTLDLCGLDVPTRVQGRNLAAVVRGTELALDDNVAFIETSGKEIGIREVGATIVLHAQAHVLPGRRQCIRQSNLNNS